MDSVNKTLYIPLYGKAYVSKRGLFLKDEKAETIWDSVSFPLKGKSRSKWLAYYMGIRSAVFDAWVRECLAGDEEAVVIHIGCGLDSRAERVGTGSRIWYDLDFPEVIGERKRFFAESGGYRMLGADARETGWLDRIPERKSAIVVMEGISMYLTPRELAGLTAALCDHFGSLALLMDCYTTQAARLSRYKNPINDVGVTRVYGMDDPLVLQTDRFAFAKEHCMTPEVYIGQLTGMERVVFRKLYAGAFAKKLYRLYAYKKA